jgi:tetratricopeptide (TPR) repeat protein
MAKKTGEIMKKTKHLLWFVPALLLAAGAVLGWEYRQYQNEQNAVHAFRTHALKGFRLRAQNRPEEAAEAYEKAYVIHQKDAQTLMDMAGVYAQLGDTEKAARLYAEAFDADSDRYDALYNAALCDYTLGHYDAALDKAQRLLHLDRKRTKYYRLIALGHYALGRTQKALAYYTRLAKNSRYANDEALKELRVLYGASPETVKPVEIVFEYETAEDTAALFALAKKYESGGFDVKALRSYQKILLSEPENAKAHVGAGKLLKKHGVRAEALEHYLAINAPDAEALEDIGALYHGMKRYDRALPYYEKAYAQNESAELARALASTAFYLKDEKKTMRYLSELQRQDPRTAHRLLYAMETESGMEHTRWQTLRYLAVELWYRFIAGVRNDA